jgi:hypothetical protein
MKNEKRSATSRLSLADLKIKAIDGKKEIEKLEGVIAGGCHQNPCSISTPQNCMIMIGANDK